MSENTSKNDDREFQLKMLEVQMSIDMTTTIFSLLVAVSYSLGVSFYSIAITSVSDELRTNLVLATYALIAGAILSSAMLFILHHYVMPRQIKKIQDRFVKPLSTETKEKS